MADEIFTPDSSRFWLKSDYKSGRPQKSLDKQYLRDWLTAQGQAGVSPPPQLPNEVCDKTAEKYFEVYKAITGKDIL